MIRKFLGEFLGTAFLLMTVVGSGIMAETLAQGNEALALLANSLATGAGLYVLIQSLGDISGAHFNPIVSAMKTILGELNKKELAYFWFAQISGAIFGVIVTHAMFGRTLFQIATKNRFFPNLWLSEIIATFGLLSVIHLNGKKSNAALNVALYITAAYWFTSSTSFANPAVTIARMFTDSFTGIQPNGALPFIMAQSVGLALGILVFKIKKQTMR